jgi:hypothetical protein
MSIKISGSTHVDDNLSTQVGATTTSARVPEKADTNLHISYICELCGFSSPNWPIDSICSAKGLGAWRGHNFQSVKS